MRPADEGNIEIHFLEGMHSPLEQYITERKIVACAHISMPHYHLPVSQKKTGHCTVAHNFAKYRSIFSIE